MTTGFLTPPVQVARAQGLYIYHGLSLSWGGGPPLLERGREAGGARSDGGGVRRVGCGAALRR